MAKHLSKKTIGILLFFSIISGAIQYLLLTEYTLKNEYLPRQMPLGEYLNYYYLNNHPRFNYLNGLWLIPGGILFFIFFCILELPVKIETTKQELKRDFYKKKFLNNTFDITYSYEK